MSDGAFLHGHHLIPRTYKQDHLQFLTQFRIDTSCAMSFKSLLLVWLACCLLVLCAAEDKHPKREAQAAMSGCKKEAGLQGDTLKKWKKGTYTDSKELRIFFRCFMKRTGMSSENGDIDIEKLVKWFPERKRENARTTMHRCLEEAGGTDEKHMKFMQCCHQGGIKGQLD